MAVERSVEGLRKNAQKKRQEAFEKVEAGIQQLIKEKRSITFNAVSEASGVSKAWLYKEADVKARIERLREQSGGQKKLPVKQKASNGSKEAIIRTLRQRIQKLEDENRKLAEQNKVASGFILKARDLEKEVERLKAVNEQLRQGTEKNTGGSSPVSLLQGLLKAKCLKLGLQWNSTLEKLFNETPESVLSSAVEALEEALKKGQAQNPGGYLNKAITDRWQPNDLPCQDLQKDFFKKWFELAKQHGLVNGSFRGNDEVQYVTLPGEGDQVQSIPLNDMVARHPLETLEN